MRIWQKLSILFILSLPVLTFSKSFPYHKKMIILDEEVNTEKYWHSDKKGDEESFKSVIRALDKTAMGHFILMKATAKAAEEGKTLLDILKVGEGSLTDTTLIRKFSPSNPDAMVFESRSVVYLNRHLKMIDAILDLGHELTHYVYRKSFNPYTDSFKLEKFIRSTVEGRGGEVDAYVVECKILNELFPGKLEQYSKCHLIVDESGKISKQKAIREFYKVGSFFEKMKDEVDPFEFDLKKESQIVRDKSYFISSAYGVPYPLAAVYEYKTIMGAACQNDKKRLTLMENKVGRYLASESVSGVEKLKGSIKVRCEHF